MTQQQNQDGGTNQAARDEDGKDATEGGGRMRGGRPDDLGGGTTGTNSKTGGDWSDASSGGGSGTEASPGGKHGGAAQEDKGRIGTESSSGDNPEGRPSDEGVDAAPRVGSGGSLGTGTGLHKGRLVGTDSPAGENANLNAEGEGQGDDLANKLGGGEGRGTGMTGAGAASGDMSASRSELDRDSAKPASGAAASDAGGPGGMGGAGANGGTTDNRPPGGSSPVQSDRNRGE